MTPAERSAEARNTKKDLILLVTFVIEMKKIFILMDFVSLPGTSGERLMARWSDEAGKCDINRTMA